MRKLAVVLVALGGVLVLSQALLMLLGTLSVLFMGESLANTLTAFGLYFMVFAVQAALALYLIRSRDSIARRLIPDDEAAPALDERTMLVAGLGILGVFLVADAVPQVISFIVSPFASAALTPNTFQLQDWGEWFQQQLPRLASAAAAIAAGLYVIARRRRLTDRLLGIPAVEEAAPEPPEHCPNCGTGYDPADYEGGVNPPLCEGCKQRLPIGDGGEHFS